MDLTFKNFSSENYADYLRIYKPYRIDLKRLKDKKYLKNLEKFGFLVGEPNSLESLQKVIVHICALFEGKVVGIIRADKFEVPQKREKTLKKFMLNKHNPIELGVIMIDKNYANRGVAKQLFSQLVKCLKSKEIKHLFSWIALNPYNKPSFNWHIKQGFQKVVQFKSKELFNIPNYSSQLFYLEIS